jgi:quercetin dioxygenase-like cupin family protein
MAKQLTVITDKEQDIHPKGWGREIWIENIPEYCGKLLQFEAGKKSSMHYHLNKLETMYLAKGSMRIDFIEPESGVAYSRWLSPGSSIQIPRGQAHQLVALEDCDLFEFSTRHEDSDSYRVWKGD